MNHAFLVPVPLSHVHIAPFPIKCLLNLYTTVMCLELAALLNGVLVLAASDDNLSEDFPSRPKHTSSYIQPTLPGQDWPRLHTFQSLDYEVL